MALNISNNAYCGSTLAKFIKGHSILNLLNVIKKVSGHEE